MRIALLRLRQTRPILKGRSSSETCRALCAYSYGHSHPKCLSVSCRQRVGGNATPLAYTPGDPRIVPLRARCGENAEGQGDSRRGIKTQVRRTSRQSRTSRDDAHLPADLRRDPQTWIRMLEIYLPRHLREVNDESDPVSAERTSQTRHDILAILHTARKSYNSGTELLTHMVVHGRTKAALWLCDRLLEHLKPGTPPKQLESPPSNIPWPREQSLHSMTRSSILIEEVSQLDFELCESWSSESPDPRYSSTMSSSKDPTMDQIWFTLGSLVVQSADMIENEAHIVMNAAQLLLSRVHNLNLVPDDVYAYQTPTHPSILRKSPIVHLLSSRILTALSDAAWRVQQEENIEKAASDGLTYEEIGRDPPGGRFRLKVRPMGPEIWLEFILWCCVEGGFESVGQRIISLLQAKTRDPWFAITWSNDNGTGLAAPRIDWDRVRSRTGGTVGRLEGYSKGQPLARIPPRTISTEVVLALVEAHVNSVRAVEGGKGVVLEAAQHGIMRLLSFLEPHDLPVSYFDYVSARLLMTRAFDSQRATDPQSRSKLLKQWLDRLTILRSLETVRQSPFPVVSFEMDSLVVHSEFAAGFMHHVLDSLVQDGNIHDALRVFNDLQKLVDNSKLHAIAAFLQQNSPPESSFFSSKGSVGNPEFTDSHGQLPLYKIAGLFNLAIDSDLVGFGQWLLYSDDPDGPLIPKRSYGNAAIARSIVRFAALSNDVHLWTVVSTPEAFARKLPTVNLLRTILNARLQLLDFDGALSTLEQLNTSQAGGYGLSNLAQLAGTVLRLERDNNHRNSVEIRHSFDSAERLLDAILAGRFDGRSGVLQQTIRATFRQQITHMLMIFQSFEDSVIADTARRYASRFRATNIPNLSASVFNVFLEAVLEVKGAAYGTRFVDKFCRANTIYEDDSRILPGDYIEEEMASDDMDENEESIAVNKYHPTSSSTTGFVPFVSESRSNSEEGHSEPEQVASSNQAVNTMQNGSQVPVQSSSGTTPFTSPYFHMQNIQSSSSNTNLDHGAGEEDIAIHPICVLNSRTVRLVVKRAMREQQSSLKMTRPADRPQLYKQYSYVWQWARRKFVDLGFTTTMIDAEIREPITEKILTGANDQVFDLKVPPKAKRRNRSRISQSFGGERKRTQDQ